MILVGVGTLLVAVVTLVVAVLALRNTRRTGELSEKLAEHQLEDRESLEIIRGLRQGMDQERQERKNLREELDQERQERQRAQQALVKAQQKGERFDSQAQTISSQRSRSYKDSAITGPRHDSIGVTIHRGRWLVVALPVLRALTSY